MAPPRLLHLHRRVRRIGRTAPIDLLGAFARGDVTVALGLLPVMLVGVASLIVFALGAATGAPDHAAAHRSARHATASARPTSAGAVRFGGHWSRTGLTVETNALLRDPRQAGLLWAGTRDGAWLSSDGGATWRRVARGLGGNGVLTLTAARHTVFAGTTDGAVYAHATAGIGPWRRLSAPLGFDHPVFSLAVSPGAGGVVLAGTFGALYRGVQTGGGWTWRRVLTSAGDAAFTSILWAPWDARRAWACAFESAPAVLTTNDGGLTWRPDTAGLPSLLPTQVLLARDLQAQQIVLSTMGGGVWLRSSASRWRDISAGLPAHHAMPLAEVALSQAVPLYAGTMGYGVYVKESGGRWRHLGRGLKGGAYTVLALLATPGHHSTLLAGTALGVFRYVPPA